MKGGGNLSDFTVNSADLILKNATVLTMNPTILLLNKPTTGLDHETKKRLIDTLVDLDMT